MSRPDLKVAVLLMTLCPALALATQVQVVGLFPGAVVLNVDGQRKLVKVGQTGPGGVQVISADSQGAVLRVDGVEGRYGLSREYNPAGMSAAPQRTQLSIARGNNGNYQVAGSIEGHPVQFLVDTGATSVAMNEHQARRLGIDYRMKGQPMKAGTAAGTVNAWRVTFDRVKVGGLEVLGVEGAVIEGDAPVEVLLGMSFLNRVKWREDQGVLLLESKF